MSDSLEKIGYSSHVEAAAVFLGFGIILGLAGGTVEAFGGSPGDILRVAEQGIAIGVFFLLCVGGLFGLLVADWKRLPRLFVRFLRWASPSVLRTGLTTGFIAAGITFGLGAGAFIPFLLFGSPEQQASAKQLLLLGVVLLLIWWPFYYMASEVLEVRRKSLNLVAGLYVFMIGVLLLNADMSAFWWYSGLVILASLAAALVTLRRLREREPNNGIYPTR